MLQLAEDSEIKCSVLLAAEVEDKEEWAKVLRSFVTKEGEALGGLVPHDCDVDRLCLVALSTTMA